MSLVLWADDDGKGSLRALEDLLGARGLQVEKFVDFISARDWIERYKDTDDLSRVSLLVDVMLPRARDTGALNPHLGVKLARVACQASIGAVCFLTVIRRAEIEERIDKLKQEFGSRTQLDFVSKLDLLEPETLDGLARFLGAPGQRPQAR